MSSDSPDLAVLRTNIHGMTADEYATELRDRLPDRTVALAETPAAERRLLREAPVATGFRIDPEALEDAAVEWFACVFAGTDHLPLDALADHGVAVTSASGVHAPNVSEHAVGAALSFARRFHVARRRGDRGVWQSYPTRELHGSTATVVGMGAIGTAILQRLAPFGVETVGVRHTPADGGPADEVVGYEALQDVLARTGYLFLAAPLTDQTRGLIDEEALLTLPADAVVVNVGRGPLVDTDALVDAIRNNRVRAAALDVTDPEPLPADHPLWTFENVLITPHNAGHTPQYWERLADQVAANLDRVDDAGDEALENRVV